MIDRMTPYVLSALLGLGVGMALFAGDAVAGDDAGPVAAAVTPAAAPTPVAPATAEAPAEPDVSGVVDALRGGQWLAGLAGLVYLLVALARKLWDPSGPWGKRGLAVAVALATTAGVALYSGAPVSAGLVVSALLAALSAAGVHHAVGDAVG